MPITLFVRKIGPMHVAEPGLTAGGRWQTKYRWISKFLTITVHRKIRLFASFNQGTASLQQYKCIPGVFSGKIYCKACFLKCENSWSHTISYRSLLLSTIVLNDKAIYITYILYFTVFQACAGGLDTTMKDSNATMVYKKIEVLTKWNAGILLIYI